MSDPGLVPAELRAATRRGARRVFVWWVNLTIAVVGVMVLGVRLGDVHDDFQRNAAMSSIPSLDWTQTTETFHMPPAEPGGPTVERTVVVPRSVKAPSPAPAQAAPRPKAERHVPLRLFLLALLLAAWARIAMLFRGLGPLVRPLVLRWLRADWLLCAVMLLAGALQLSVLGFVVSGWRQFADFAIQFRGTLLVAMVMLVVLRLFFRPAERVAPREPRYDEDEDGEGAFWEDETEEDETEEERPRGR